MKSGKARICEICVEEVNYEQQLQRGISRLASIFPGFPYLILFLFIGFALLQKQD